MKKSSIPLFLLASAAIAAADLPRPTPVTRYAGLWTNSPFTTKPPPPGPATEVNPLEDYALGGISPIAGGYRITLLNRKNPEERIVIPDNKEFKILSVQYSPNPLETTVRLSSGTKTGSVTFDETLLTLKTPPPPAQPQPGATPAGAPGAQPPGVPGAAPNANGQAPANGESPRQPRPRVVAPANPANPGAAAQGSPPPQPTAPQPRINTQQRVPRR